MNVPTLIPRKQIVFQDAKALKSQWSFFVLAQFVGIFFGVVYKFFLPEITPLISEILEQTFLNSVFILVFIASVGVDVAFIKALAARKSTQIVTVAITGFVLLLPFIYVWPTVTYDVIVLLINDNQELIIRDEASIAVGVIILAVALTLWNLFIVGKIILALKESNQAFTNVVKFNDAVEIMDTPPQDYVNLEQIYLYQHDRIFGTKETRQEKVAKLGIRKFNNTRVIKVNNHVSGFSKANRKNNVLEHLYVQASAEGTDYAAKLLEDFTIMAVRRKHYRAFVKMPTAVIGNIASLFEDDWDLESSNDDYTTYSKTLR